MDQEVITLREAARRLSVSASTLRRWHRCGRLAFVRLPGGALRIRRSDIDRIVATSEGGSDA